MAQRVIYLRDETGEIADALDAAAAADLRSKNAYGLEVLAQHLRASGHLE